MYCVTNGQPIFFPPPLNMVFLTNTLTNSTHDIYSPAYSHVTLCAKDSSKRKLLRQEALAEGGHRCCISNIAWTIVMLPSHLLYFPSVGKALPHICTASKAARDIFFFPFLKWRKPKTKASLRTQRAILKWKTKMGKGVSR